MNFFPEINPKTTDPLPHMPQLDGLRALAVTAVLIHHYRRITVYLAVSCLNIAERNLRQRKEIGFFLFEDLIDCMLPPLQAVVAIGQTLLQHLLIQLLQSCRLGDGNQVVAPYIAD